MEEIWKRVKDYPDYEVSNKGRVLSHKRGWTGLLKLRPDLSHGYEKITLSENGRQKAFDVHRLVLEVFIGPCPLGHETNHKDGVKSNNNLENLEWVTPSENATHAHQTGLIRLPPPFGEKSSKAKLKDGEVHLIKKLLRKGIKQITIAKMFKVTPGCISHIKTERYWDHINEF